MQKPLIDDVLYSRLCLRHKQKSQDVLLYENNLQLLPNALFPPSLDHSTSWSVLLFVYHSSFPALSMVFYRSSIFNLTVTINIANHQTFISSSLPLLMLFRQNVFCHVISNSKAQSPLKNRQKNLLIMFIKMSIRSLHIFCIYSIIYFIKHVVDIKFNRQGDHLIKSKPLTLI